MERERPTIVRVRTANSPNVVAVDRRYSIQLASNFVGIDLPAATRSCSVRPGERCGRLRDRVDGDQQGDKPKSQCQGGLRGDSVRLRRRRFNLRIGGRPSPRNATHKGRARPARAHLSFLRKPREAERPLPALPRDRLRFLRKRRAREAVPTARRRGRRSRRKLRRITLLAETVTASPTSARGVRKRDSCVRRFVCRATPGDHYRLVIASTAPSALI